MKRFDAGLQSAKAFIDGEMGELLALKAWYCDSTHRYQLTDAVQPLIVASSNAKRPPADPKANLEHYYMFAHGCHLLDTARYLAGEIVEVDARLRRSFGAYCWFVDVAFSSGAIGHLDLTVAVRMDWHEGFQIYGEHGSVVGKTYNPWLFKTSDVEIFHESNGTTTRLLGADGHFYRRQLEGFAAAILDHAPMTGADIDDGLASVHGMVAISQSVRTRPASPLSRGAGGPTMKLGIFARTFAGATPQEILWSARRAGYEAVQYNMACSGLSPLPLEISDETAEAIYIASVETGVAIAAVSATYNMIDPNLSKREEGRRSFAAIARSAHRMGTSLLTVCTGSCDPHDQWRYHPDNSGAKAWREMCKEFELLLAIADKYDVMLGVEPELANVVDSAQRARELIDTFGDKRIRIIFDAANLFEVDSPQRRRY